ncbi:uncharacterized protein E0L32_008281 [Thyridium curvatum]|uniref:Elongator complex protein 6 n=1 Tax=Thyridium curvatum TaxID=1093900 RepID=A0A507ALT9_9PEZI|nr:uncharacterized protein E0L32_008281 [Thyridium curvatum]TPX10712.1 hypothetical protein E0L32_008281 [Thyridium curvatum]
MALRTPPGPSSSLSNRSIPPLLEPCLALPPAAGSLALLTSVLGASTNWLVLRYLTAYLLSHHQLPAKHRQANDDEEEEAGGEQRQQDVSVVLVSFMRDYAFWRDGAGRLGLDLEMQSRKGRFKFIDGLTGLFLDGGGGAVAKGNQTSSSSSSTGAAILSASSGLSGIGRTIHAAVDELLASSGAGGGQPKVVLVIDQPDLLLAATAGDESALRQGSAVTSGGLQDLLLDLRELSRDRVGRRASGIVTIYDVGKGTRSIRTGAGAPGGNGSQLAVVGHGHGQ